MKAVDTNLLVRILIGDDVLQTEQARALFASEQIWIPKTVLLEADWVLRSAYGATRDFIRKAFRGVMGLRNVQIEDAPAVLEALRLGEQGVDFADALHLASRPQSATFVSFDEMLVRRAHRASVPGVKLAGKNIIN